MNSITSRYQLPLSLATICLLVYVGSNLAPVLRNHVRPQPSGWQTHPERFRSRDYPSGKLHVLFVGNSYTFYNDLPCIVQELSAREAQPIEFEMVTFGGSGFDFHYQNGITTEAIHSRKWDYVVLQEYSLRPIDDRNSFFKYGRLLNEAVVESGSKTMFFMTWARQATPERQAILTGAYTALADSLHAAVAPVGVAWQKSLKSKPSLLLHIEDGTHPRPEGSYLAACVFYSMFYDKSARGLPSKMELHTSNGIRLLAIKPEDAAFLQEMADEAVKFRRKSQP